MNRLSVSRPRHRRARSRTSETGPVEHFGLEIGADYHVADSTQFEAHWRTLAAESCAPR